MRKIICLLIGIGLTSFLACKRDGIDITYDYYGEENYEELSAKLNLPNQLLSYDIVFPEHAPFGNFSFNDDLVTLGRVLFYDTNLSLDRSVSCASCHKQALAFSDDVAFSKGIDNHITDRNSLALGSVISFQGYYGSATFGLVPFFWDNRASSANDQTEETLKNNKEMGMSDDLMVSRVKEQSFYEPLVNKAHNKTLETITSAEVISAIGAFVNALGSFNNKFDQAYDDFLSKDGNNVVDIGTKDFAMFSPLENQGKNLYVANCGACHGRQQHGPDKILGNNGLSAIYSDKGIGALSSKDDEYGLFKVPTLRNVQLTAPYMHDGSIETLEQVIDHYSNGIANHPNLSAELQDENGDAMKFNYSQEEKSALLAFLNTLTDTDYIVEERYSDPFK